MAGLVCNFVRKKKCYAGRDSKAEMSALRTRVYTWPGWLRIGDVAAMPEMRLPVDKKNRKANVRHFLADMPPSDISCL